MIRLAAWIDAVSSPAARWLNWIGVGLLLPALALLVSAEVTIRYGFSGSIRWSSEVSQLLLLLVFFFSLPHCSRIHGHVYMELAYTRFGPGLRRLADCVAALCGLLFSGAFLWQAIWQTEEMFRYGDGAEQVDLHYWPFSALLTMCGALLTLTFLVQLLRALVGQAEDRGADDA